MQHHDLFFQGNKLRRICSLVRRSMLTSSSSASSNRCVRVAAGAALLLLLLVTLVASGSASRQFLDPQERFVSEAELIEQQEQKMLVEEQTYIQEIRAQDDGRGDPGRDQATSHLRHHLAAPMRALTALCLCRTRRPRFGAMRCIRSPGAAASTRRPCGSRRTSRRPPSCSSRGSSITGPAKCPPSPSRSWCEAGPELATLPSVRSLDKRP